jgi:hypothetical protein
MLGVVVVLKMINLIWVLVSDPMLYVSPTIVILSFLRTLHWQAAGEQSHVSMERGACTTTDAATSCFSSSSLVYNRDPALTAKGNNF